MENKNPENRFFHSDETPDSQKAGRILYIVIISVLCISAILVGVFAALNRSSDEITPPTDSGEANPPSDNLPPDSGETDGTPDTDRVPTFVAPVVGLLTENYSPDMPVFNLTMNDFRSHDGVDIAAELGAPVFAVADGTVTKIWDDPMMGKCLSLSMNGKAVATYQNLGAVAEGLAAGTQVKSGDTLAVVGESALLECGEEPHLHFSLTVNDALVDPVAYFSDEVIETSLSKDSSYEG